jgi:hypothetical protein
MTFAGGERRTGPARKVPGREVLAKLLFCVHADHRSRSPR